MNIAELKKGGFLKQLQKDYFAVRLRVAGGNLTLEQVETIQQVAKKYGKGYIHLTTRQGIEIPFIHFDQIDAVMKRRGKEEYKYYTEERGAKYGKKIWERCRPRKRNWYTLSAKWRAL
ncbi:MAG: hypothetical protein AAGT88_01525 [Dethiobacter sp.]